MRKRLNYIFIALLLLVTVLSVPAMAAGDDLYYTDFGGTPYTGMSESSTSFVVDQLCGKDYVLETVINAKYMSTASGRGIKFILRAHPLASSGDLEVWIGREFIWACATGWTGRTEFDFSPYMNRDTTIRILVQGKLLKIYLDGYEAWSCEDVTFNVGSETNIEFGGWDAKYEIKSVRVSPASKNNSIPVPSMKNQYTYQTPQTGGTTYYVDNNAAEGGNGLSPETAWKTIEQVNAHGAFLPGDKILFKRGGVWLGETLQPLGYGVEGNPIVVDSYGSGALPVIDRRGPWNPGGLNGTSAMILKNQSYWTIRNIQLSNQNPVNPGKVEDVVVLADHAEFPMRNGLTVASNYIIGYKNNTIKGIVLENVVFANIDGTMGDEGNCYHYRVDPTKSGWAGGGALCIRAHDLDGGTSRAYFDGITVSGCTFRNIGSCGVSVESGWEYYDSFKNLVVRDSRFYNEQSYKATCAGAYITSADAPLIENNSFEHLTNGIGLQIVNNAVVQYNTIVDMDGYLHTMSKFMGSEQHWDGCGIDTDTRCKGTSILRNNYIERCYAGSFGMFDYDGTEAANIIIENNVSYNSDRFIYYQCDASSYKVQVKNNTVVRTNNSPYKEFNKVIDVYNGTAKAGTYTLTGNVFHYPNQTVTMDKSYATGNGNVYNGVTGYKDSAAVKKDPKINLPGSTSDTASISYSGGVAGTKSFSDSGLFTFQSGSPCLSGDSVAYGATIKTYVSSNPGGDTGNQGGNTGNQGGNTGNEGGNTGNEGGNTGNPGGNTGNQGGNTGNQGGNTGNQGGNTGNQGGNTGNEGGNTGNQGGIDATNPGGDTGNGGDAGNDATNPGGDTGNSSNAGNDATNPGGNTGNQGGSSSKPGDDAPQTENDDAAALWLAGILTAVICLGGCAAAAFVLWKKGILVIVK